jgi:hypothetical protein
MSAGTGGQKQMPENLLDEVIDTMRIWLRNNSYPLAADCTDSQKILKTFHSLYVDGFCGWLADTKAAESTKATIWLLMVRRFGLDFANRIVWCS